MATRGWSLPLACLALIACSRLPAEEIQGKVLEVDGDTVRIEVDGDSFPNVGDPVEVYFRIPDLDDICLVGSGSLIEASGDRIVARIEPASAKAKTGHLVRIQSEHPRKARARPALDPRDWTFSSPGEGGACEQSEAGDVILSIAEGGGGEGVYLRTKPLTGDFDLSVRVDLMEWPTPEGSFNSAGVLLRGEVKYDIFRNFDATKPGTLQDEFVTYQGSEQTELRLPQVGAGGKSFRLRMVRQGGHVTAFIAPEPSRRPPEWVEAARFETSCNGPLQPVLDVSNIVGSSKVHPAIRVRFAEWTLQGGR